MRTDSGQSCIRGLRHNRVTIDTAKLISPPQSGQVKLLGSGFAYTAKSDFEGQDSFTIQVSGMLKGIRGSSDIRIIVSVGPNVSPQTSPTERSDRPPADLSSAAQPNKNPSIPAGNSSVTVTAKNTYTVTIDHPSGNKSAQSIPVNVTTLADSGSTPFTPLHTYYVSPTGSDSNNGLTPATAWATANHSVVCGDVIIAAAGSYGARFGDETGNAFGTVSNCPSTTGGIDGTGGIYFAVLLCGGPDLMSCQANGGSGPAFEIDKSNWAVEGFWATMASGAGGLYPIEAWGLIVL